MRKANRITEWLDVIKKYRHIMFLILLCVMLLFAESEAGERLASVFSGTKGEETVVVIDAGHGGNDPGKVGSAGTLEKDVNLAIALKLKKLLEEQGIKVVMTRETDCGLYSEGTKNKKREDMAERVRIISEEKPLLAVSIHQNSFTTPDCKGAQMFYYAGSEKGKKLAGTLQTAFLETMQDGNTRVAKENKDYYLLRKAPCTMVIAECGFLSNPEEEALLSGEEYQKKAAQALMNGIVRYLGEEKSR